MEYFIYDGVAIPLNSFDLHRKGREPYTLDFSGAIRPKVIYKIIDDVFKKGDFKKPYSVCRVDCSKHGGFDFLNLIFKAGKIDTFEISRKIVPAILEFSADKKIDIPDEIRNNLCICFNKSVYLHDIEIRGIISINIIFNGLGKLLYLRFGDNYRNKYQGSEIDHIKIISPNVEYSKIIGVLEFSLKFEREYEGEYMFTITDILDVQY
ncbi:MAG: hypothetical protein WC877_01285 [Dehalococcoidales bacterium]|jgi:hypothetical protein